MLHRWRCVHTSLCIMWIETVTLINYHKAITLPTLGDAEFEHLLRLRIGQSLNSTYLLFHEQIFSLFFSAEQVYSLPNHKVSSFFKKVICLLLLVLSLCCFEDFSLVAASRVHSRVAACGLLFAVASLNGEHRLWATWAQKLRLPGPGAQAQKLWCLGLVAPWHVGSCLIRDWTPVSPQSQFLIHSPHGWISGICTFQQRAGGRKGDVRELGLVSPYRCTLSAPQPHPLPLTVLTCHWLSCFCSGQGSLLAGLAVGTCWPSGTYSPKSFLSRPSSCAHLFHL